MKKQSQNSISNALFNESKILPIERQNIGGVEYKITYLKKKLKKSKLLGGYCIIGGNLENV